MKYKTETFSIKKKNLSGAAKHLIIVMKVTQFIV